MLKCLKNHCNHSFSQQTPYSYHCLLQRTRLKSKNNIVNKYDKVLLNLGKAD